MESFCKDTVTKSDSGYQMGIPLCLGETEAQRHQMLSYNPTGFQSGTWKPPGLAGWVPPGLSHAKGDERGEGGSGDLLPCPSQPQFLSPTVPSKKPLTNCILSMNVKETLPGCCIWVSAWKDKAGCHPTSPWTALSPRYAMV